MDTLVAPDRKIERQNLLREIRRDIKGVEKIVGDFHLYRILGLLCDKQLSVEPSIADGEEKFRLGSHGQEVLRLFRRIDSRISRFEASEVERKALFARIIAWCTSKTVAPHFAALKRLDRLEQEATDASPRTPP